MMTEYQFLSVWQIDAPVQAVYEAIYHCARWPHWWKGVERVLDLAPDGDPGVGKVLRYTWKGVLPYRLTFDMRITRIEPLVALEGVATGDLEGIGRWSFSHRDSVTTVRYEWCVRPTKRWMSLLAPLVRPVFKWNHDAVMRQGALGLARVLNARLIDIAHR